MLGWLANKVYDALEPKLKELIKFAIAEAGKEVTEEVDTSIDKLIAVLKKLPVIGGLF